MEATGKIIAVLPARSGVSARTGNPWMTQEYVLETTEQYPKKIPFEVFSEDKIRQLNLQQGDAVTISFDIDGREWNGRWFPSIRCFNAIKLSGTQQQGQQQVTQQPQQAAPQQTTQVPNTAAPQGQDDLPF